MIEVGGSEMNNKELIVKNDYESISTYAASLIENIITNLNKKIINIALSGGNTPKLMFEKLSKSTIIDWKYVNIFIVDERHINNNHNDSNSKLIKEVLIDKIDIPKSNFHIVKYFDDPYKSLKNYKDDISSHFNIESKLYTPKFDLIHLGIGTDGHTASIFPNKNIDHSKLLDISQGDKYKRITFTYRLLNNSDNIIFLVSGNKKANIMEKVYNNKADLPAMKINNEGSIYYLLDNYAAKRIKIKK
ncbi:MAG: 6-phosphogluconolactonase [Halanaerobiales bacterium]|nr:6-phosphogluconolactonase [Halanaerobiales bacterium]